MSGSRIDANCGRGATKIYRLCHYQGIHYATRGDRLAEQFLAQFRWIDAPERSLILEDCEAPSDSVTNEITDKRSKRSY